MEGITVASIQKLDFKERVLPTLENNIKSGNSLVDVDFYDSVIDFGEEKKVKPFNWQKAFPEVFEQGGFDAVIGNPPYVILSPDFFPNDLITYCRKYSVAQYKCDLYHLFFERGLSILNQKGILGYITPSNWMTQKFTDLLRKFVLNNGMIQRIIDFNYKVFEQADVYTEIIIINNKKPNANHSILYYQVQSESSFLKESNFIHQNQLSFLDNKDATIDFRLLTNEGRFINRIVTKNPVLSEVARATLGCQAYNSSKHTKEQILNRVFHSEEKLSEEYLPELTGSDVGRYTLERKKGKWIKYGSWLHDYRSMDWLSGERILVREITGKPPYRIQATFVIETYCNYKTILNVNPSAKTKFSMKYLCGILNSSLISFIFPYLSNKLEAGSFPRISVGDLKKIPIKNIDFNNSQEKHYHDEIDNSVNLILELNIKLAKVKIPSKLEQIKSQIEFLENKINQLVYQLYELTEEEIKIVEGKK
jgi:hypothetical protein